MLYIWSFCPVLLSLRATSLLCKNVVQNSGMEPEPKVWGGKVWALTYNNNNNKLQYFSD